MQKSESIASLAKALVKANINVKNPSKNAKNPHFKNRYATLDAVIEAYKSSYLENGISVFESPIVQDGKVGVTITLLHESGEFITHDPFLLPVGKNDAQGHGSAMTYSRRYALSAVMNIAADEDDDGNGAADDNTSSNQQNGTYNARNDKKGTNTNDNPKKSNEAKFEAIKAKYKKLTGSLKTYPTFEKAVKEKNYSVDKIDQLVDHNLAVKEKFGGPIAILCSANGKDPEETQTIIENFLAKGITFEQILTTLEAAVEKKQKEAEGKDQKQ